MFDLTAQPWVPVIEGGRSRLASLTEALTRANELDGLDFRRPLEAFAVLRVLVAVHLAAVGELPDDERAWTRHWDSGSLDVDAVVSYLGAHREQFDLFSPDRPFAQTAGLQSRTGDVKPVSLLLAEVPSGNNVPLFGGVTDAHPLQLAPAQAAAALLATIGYDTAGIKTGAAGDPRMKDGKVTCPLGPLGQLGGIIPTGATLLQTLMLNTPIADRDEELGTPAWERPTGPDWQPRPPDGLLDLLTWPARRVRLVTADTADGEQAVTGVVLTSGDRMEHTPLTEPHTLWRIVAKPEAGAPPSAPRRHQPGTASWRGLRAVLAVKGSEGDVRTSRLLEQLQRLVSRQFLPASTQVSVVAVGVAYGTQKAVIEDVYLDEIPLPVLALLTGSGADPAVEALGAAAVRQLVLDMADQAESLRRAANSFGDRLRLAAGGEKTPRDKGPRLGELLLHELDPTARRLLAGLAAEPGKHDLARDAWVTTARSAALGLIPAALAATAPSAVLGRPSGDERRPHLAPAALVALFRSDITTILGRAGAATTPLEAA